MVDNQKLERGFIYGTIKEKFSWECHFLTIKK